MMLIPATVRLYLLEDECFETKAHVLAIRENLLAADRTCFYPGGGGQPPDTGTMTLASGERMDIISAQADEHGVIWHSCGSPIPPDVVEQSIRLSLERERRLALMRNHTALHVLNTVVLRDFGGWITGVQIGVETSRIDFKLDSLTSTMCTDVEQRVNAILEQDHPLKAYYIPEKEFAEREDLLRTLEARPPVKDSRVRVVEIVGFEAQACGGTHVRNTREVGRLTIVRTENKGRDNKRLYVRLERPG
jgi:misacylated tRNA(Ala) deacylase